MNIIKQQKLLEKEEELKEKKEKGKFKFKRGANVEYVIKRGKEEYVNPRFIKSGDVSFQRSGFVNRK